MSLLPPINSPSRPQTNNYNSPAPSARRQQQLNYFSPGSFQHHPLFQTSTNESFTAAPPASYIMNRASIISPSSSFTNTYNGSGNYTDQGLGSVKRKEEIMEKTKLRKQNSIVERARMKQELLKLEEMKRQRRFKVRELKRRQKVRESAAAVSCQRVYRGYEARTHLSINKFVKEAKSVNQIIRCFRTYCLVRIAKADRGVLDKIRNEDKAARVFQLAMRLWKLRKEAKKQAQALREKREADRLEYIRLLREQAACYIQRIFRGIGGRTRVVKMAVEQQVAFAQNRIDNEEEEEKKDKILAEKKRNRFASVIKKKGQ